MATNRTTPGTFLHLPSEEPANQEELDDMRKNAYLVVWWMSQVPYAAVFDNRVAAEAAASVRNALMVTLSGGDAKIDSVDRKSTRLNSSHRCISYAVFCLKKKKK